MLVKFSINTARDGAWELQQEVRETGSAFNDCFNVREIIGIAELGKIHYSPIEFY